MSALTTLASIVICIRRISPLAALHIEHIIPRIHGGADELDNLALACIDCNLHKGTNLTGIDPQTDEVTELFHPRVHDWNEHFKWDGIYLFGTTATGRPPSEYSI